MKLKIYEKRSYWITLFLAIIFLIAGIYLLYNSENTTTYWVGIVITFIFTVIFFAAFLINYRKRNEPESRIIEIEKYEVVDEIHN